jgi:hypothetical protein
MKSQYLFCILLCAAGLVQRSAVGEIELELSTDHTKYIEFEPVVAFLTLENVSDRAFLIRSDDATLDTRVDFHLEVASRNAGGREKAASVLNSCLILGGEKQAFMVDLSTHYQLGRSGRYTLWATAHWNGETFESAPIHIRVVTGLPMASRERTVPGVGGRDRRRFSLRYLDRDESESIFLIADDLEEGQNYGVFDLGKLVRFHKPSIDVTPSGRITVYHQSSPTFFTKSVLQSDPKGLRLLDQQYESESRKGKLDFSDSAPEKNPPASNQRTWWPFGNK